jgi:hypothetical protein
MAMGHLHRNSLEPILTALHSFSIPIEEHRDANVFIDISLSRLQELFYLALDIL